MNLFKKKENRTTEIVFDEELLSAILDTTIITKKEALAIPAVSACIEIIGNIVSMLPIKLYEEVDGKTQEISDNRTRLLSKETGDTLTSTQMWKAIVEDYYLGKGAYIYIDKVGNDIKSLRYVDESVLSIQKNTDPIFKDYNINVLGKSFYPFEFIKILRRSHDGARSESILTQLSLALGVMYNVMDFEETLVKKGGNKKGFLKSKRGLTEPALASLKESFRLMYSNNRENVVILNDGLEWQDTSNTSVEMQLNENKKVNAEEMCKIFLVPPQIISGKATEVDYKNLIKHCIMPLLNIIENSLDRDLLLESEKDNRYFAFDTKKITRGSIKERYEAYQIALRNNFMQIDEVRNEEDLEALGINWITLGLDQVLYDPTTNSIYTPNTNQISSMDEKTLMKGGKE